MPIVDIDSKNRHIIKIKNDKCCTSFRKECIVKNGKKIISFDTGVNGQRQTNNKTTEFKTKTVHFEAKLKIKLPAELAKSAALCQT